MGGDQMRLPWRAIGGKNGRATNCRLGQVVAHIS
jgi:hypothetical protein